MCAIQLFSMLLWLDQTCDFYPCIPKRQDHFWGIFVAQELDTVGWRHFEFSFLPPLPFPATG